MGGSESKVEQLNEVVTEMAIESMINATANCSGNIIMKQEIIVGEGATVANITQEQLSKINLSCINDSSVSQNLQADLIAKVMNAATNNSSAFPMQITGADNTSKIENIMRTNLSNTMEQSAEAALNLAMTQEQRLVVGRGGTAYNISQKQYGEAAGQLANSLSGEIVAALQQSTDLSNEASNTTTFFATDMLDSIGSTMSNIASSIFEFSNNTMIMVVVGLIAFAVAGYFATRGGGGGGK